MFFNLQRKPINETGKEIHLRSSSESIKINEAWRHGNSIQSNSPP